MSGPGLPRNGLINPALYVDFGKFLLFEFNDVRARFAAIGIDAVGNTPEEFAAQIKVEIAKWGKAICDAKIGVN